MSAQRHRPKPWKCDDPLIGFAALWRNEATTLNSPSCSWLCLYIDTAHSPSIEAKSSSYIHFTPHLRFFVVTRSGPPNPPSEMASLDALPNELLDLISSRLSPDDLLQLSTTCKVLYAYAQPLAYRNVTLTWIQREEAPRSPKLHALLRTLIEKPNLARAIKRLGFEAEGCMYFVVDGFGEYDSETDQHFEDNGPLKLEIPGSDEKPSNEEIALLRRAIASQGLSEHESWTDEAVRSQEFYASMAMIVAQCVKLESLDVSVAFCMQNEWFDEMVQIGRTSPGGSSAWLENLRHIRLSCNTGGYEWTPRCMALQTAALQPFYLPKLETLELDQFHYPGQDGFEEDADFRAKFWPASLSPPDVTLNLTTLRLIRTSASPRTLRELLGRTPNLRTLQFDAFESFDNQLFNLSHFKSALDLVKETLTSLSVRFQYYNDEDNDPSGEYGVAFGRLGSFRDYLALEHLEVSLHTLFGSEAGTNDRHLALAHMLPPTLQSLTITDDLWFYAEFQGEFVDFDAMAMFRWYLMGQIADDATQYPQRNVIELMRWTQELPQGEWRTATPQLKKCVYDLRKRGYLSREYWNKGKARKQFRTMCKDQGLEGEVLWDKIQYWG
jgi:hypothetical protein